MEAQKLDNSSKAQKSTQQEQSKNQKSVKVEPPKKSKPVPKNEPKISKPDPKKLQIPKQGKPNEKKTGYFEIPVEELKSKPNSQNKSKSQPQKLLFQTQN